jgi:hypothetical protein
LLALAGLIAAPALPACRKPPTQAARAPMVVDDDIEAIERQLANNADNLRSEGILIARAEAPAPEPTTPAVVDDSADDAGAAGDGDLAGEDAVAGSTEALEVEEAEMEPPAAAPADEGAYRSKSVVRDRRADRRYARARKKEERSRCERICDLAEATCDLAEQICDLADRHVDEVRYEDACERAAEQCRVASTACTNCED